MTYEESNPFQIPCILKRIGFKRTWRMEPHIQIHRFDRVDAWAKEEKVKLVRKRIRNFEILRSKDETLKFETDWILCIQIKAISEINHTASFKMSQSIFWYCLSTCPFVQFPCYPCPLYCLLPGPMEPEITKLIITITGKMNKYLFYIYSVLDSETFSESEDGECVSSDSPLAGDDAWSYKVHYHNHRKKV